MTTLMRAFGLSFALLGVMAGAASAHPHHRPAAHSHHHAKHTRVRAHPSAVTASFYGMWHKGRQMANGKRFQPYAMTAASKTLPLGARVRVTNLDNHRATVVLITDRMKQRGRSIDLSLGAARRLGMQKCGLAHVSIHRLV